jgi:hypothetical protein
MTLARFRRAGLSESAFGPATRLRIAARAAQAEAHRDGRGVRSGVASSGGKSPRGEQACPKVGLRALG